MPSLVRSPKGLSVVQRRHVRKHAPNPTDKEAMEAYRQDLIAQFNLRIELPTMTNIVRKLRRNGSSVVNDTDPFANHSHRLVSGGGRRGSW